MKLCQTLCELYMMTWRVWIGRMDHEIEDEKAAVEAEKAKGNQKVLHTLHCGLALTKCRAERARHLL